MPNSMAMENHYTDSTPEFASPRYRAPGQELKGMNQWQSILGLGAFYHLEKHSLMFGFSEDLLTNHSEDFSLIFSWLGSFRE